MRFFSPRLFLGSNNISRTILTKQKIRIHNNTTEMYDHLISYYTLVWQYHYSPRLMKQIEIPVV